MAQSLRRSQRLKQKQEKLQAVNNTKNTKNAKTSKEKKEKKRKETIGKKENSDSKNKSKEKKNYWLMKSEPSAYSIDDLMEEQQNGDYWDGIRNYQVRNMIRDEIKCNDEAIFYHSCCKPPGIAGSMMVTKASYPDFTAFDKTEKYFDPKSDPKNPRWFMFNVRFKSKFKHFISLKELKEIPELKNMKILQKGNRLSITRITKQEYDVICEIGNK